MNKKSFFIPLLAAGTLLLLCVFGSCDEFFTPNSGEGTISLTLPGQANTGRATNGGSINNITFTVELLGPDTKTFEAKPGEQILVKVSPGYWYVNITATYADGSPVGTGQGEGDVKKGKVTVIVITLGGSDFINTINASEFNAVAVDSAGSVYAAGYVNGSGFDDAPSFTGRNVLLVKYNSDGHVVWAKTIDDSGTGASEFNAVAVDSANNVYAAGYVTGTSGVNFGTGQKTAGTNSGKNILLIKYNDSGTVQWVQTVAEGTGVSEFNAVAVDSTGNIYAAGYQKGKNSFTYGSKEAQGKDNAENSLLVKYDTTTGTAQSVMVSTETAVGYSMFNAVAVDSTGNVYAAGYQKAGINAREILLVKFGTNGNTWKSATTANVIFSTSFQAVTVDSSGNIYAAGYEQGGFNHNFGNNQYPLNLLSLPILVDHSILVKYNPDGTTQWAKTVAPASTSVTGFNGVTADGNDIYAVGYKKGTESITYGNLAPVSGVNSNKNILMVKYDTGGIAQSARTVVSGNNSTTFRGVAVSGSVVYATGYQEGTGAFDYGTGQSIQRSKSGYNALLLKY
ncbi:hypothetical protein AGMMS50293_00990 [Spirochaetia bacterium]|nr:hypothetical protein AGMMS50293_00990 [Spirochaetia bacterium]